MAKQNYVFTSESVSEGHPDKVSDRISDAIVDLYLSHDPYARVAVETLCTANQVVLAGEVRGPDTITPDMLVQVARHAVKDIGYERDGFHWDQTDVKCFVHSQSADIAMGVNASDEKEEGAGDQGIMFGYACNETPARTIGPNPYLWHRILLWSPEAQVAHVSAEAGARTETVLAQIEREASRQRMTRGEFLASLSAEIVAHEVTSAAHPGFARALELVNKTNQFNTTGRRWTHEECALAFDRGVSFHTFEVQDRFTSYGNIGVLVVDGAGVAQFVMSCRVIGIDVELAALSDLLLLLREHGVTEVTAALKETPMNLPCRDLYSRCGFSEQSPGVWARPIVPALAMPKHIRLKHANRRKSVA